MNLDRILPLAAPLLRRGLRAKQALREQLFAAVPQTPDRVVFLGDSITEWGTWEDWFPEFPTSNRGIGGQAICDLLGRLDTAIVRPRAVSLLIGTNDLHGLGNSHDTLEIARQMGTLVERIRHMAPSAPLLINSVMPRSPVFRDRILELNRSYKEIAERTSSTFVDLWSALAGPDGSIRRELTADGLHLSIAGYKTWVDVLRPHLAPFAS
jgi:lysophospholipase L1-like esterase